MQLLSEGEKKGGSVIVLADIRAPLKPPGTCKKKRDDYVLDAE